MTLPVKVQQLCNQYLEKIRQDKQHHLLPVDRLTIYQAFGPSNHLDKRLEGSTLEGNLKYIPVTFSKADLAFGWLSVISARKVMPIWLEAKIDDDDLWDDEDYSNNPITFLEEAEGVLLGTISQEKAFWDLCGRFYDAISGLDHSATEKVCAANSAAYYALEVTLGGLRNWVYSANSDDQTWYSRGDSAAMAYRAYAAIDENEPEMWAQARSKKTYLKIDLKKRLEFWEWWLLEAIPQAWELANQSKPQTSY